MSYSAWYTTRMISETAFGLGATSTGLLGTASFFAPEYTPHDWTFVHQNALDFQIAGGALWGVAGVLTLLLAGKRMNQVGWEKVDSQKIQIVSPTPQGIEAGRRDDQRRVRKAARKS